MILKMKCSTSFFKATQALSKLRISATQLFSLFMEKTGLLASSVRLIVEVLDEEATMKQRGKKDFVSRSISGAGVGKN